MKKILNENIKVGLTSMAGIYAVNTIGNLPGMPDTTAVKAPLMAGIGLANVGQLVKTTKSFTSVLGDNTKSKKKLNIKW